MVVHLMASRFRGLLYQDGKLARCKPREFRRRHPPPAGRPSACYHRGLAAQTGDFEPLRLAVPGAVRRTLPQCPASGPTAEKCAPQKRRRKVTPRASAVSMRRSSARTTDSSARKVCSGQKDGSEEATMAATQLEKRPIQKRKSAALPRNSARAKSVWPIHWMTALTH